MNVFLRKNAFYIQRIKGDNYVKRVEFILYVKSPIHHKNLELIICTNLTSNLIKIFSRKLYWRNIRPRYRGFAVHYEDRLQF